MDDIFYNLLTIINFENFEIKNLSYIFATEKKKQIETHLIFTRNDL